MAKGFFVTGTDTGVGKTIITAALVKAAQLLGFKVCGMKPIETGCKRIVDSRQHAEYREIDYFLQPSDGLFLRKISDTSESIDLITPVRFENPLAPMPASEIEGRQADLEKIRIAYGELSRKYTVIIMEGIGGILVPIKKDYFVLDMARDFGLPVIVVSKPGLGTINHTMLTVNYAIKAELTVAGIIINLSQPSSGTLAENTNPDVLQKVCPAPLIGIFPFLKNFEGSTIERAVLKHLNLEIIRKYL